MDELILQFKRAVEFDDYLDDRRNTVKQATETDLLAVYRVENEDMVDLGEHSPIEAEKLAKRLSIENGGIEYCVDRGTEADMYRDGLRTSVIRSSTTRVRP